MADTENQRLVDVIEFPENIRVNSAMYIGDRETSSHILREIIDNSVDEALDPNSTCDEIHIFQGKENDWNTRWLCVTDNGRGIPILDSPKKPGQTMPEVSISMVGSGSNFADRKGERTSIGCNGCGSAACNALSNHYYLAIKMARQMHNLSGAPKWFQDQYAKSNDKDYYLLHFEKGIKKEEIFVSKQYLIDKFTEFNLDYDFTTFVAFQPDTDSIFTRTDSNPTKDLRYLQPFLRKIKNRELKFWINGEPYQSDWSQYKWEVKTTCGSLYNEDYLQKKAIFDTLSDEEKKKFRLPIKPRNTSAEIYVTFEVDMEKLDNPTFTGSVNGLIVPKRVHTDWVRQAFSLAMKNVYAVDFKQKEFLGMNFDVIFSCVAPEFNSQTKEILVRVDGISSQDIVPKLSKEFEKIIRSNREVFDAHADRVKKLLMTMANLSLQDYCKAKVPTSNDARRYHAALKDTKLKDARSSNRQACELYLCFTGDTKMRDCNDQTFTLKELSERDLVNNPVYTFSCTPKGELVPAKVIKAGVTGQATDMVRVTLDNGESFECTPNHKMLMKSGEYKEAGDLQAGESLMPLYIWTTEDSTMYDGHCQRRSAKATKGSGEFIYRIMSHHNDCEDHSTGEDIVHVHHKWDGYLNDYPNALEKVDQTWHRSHHGGEAIWRRYMAGERPNDRFFGTDDLKRQHQSESRLNYYHNTKEGAEMRQHLSEVSRRQWDNEELRKWRSNATRQYAAEHPEWAKENCGRKSKQGVYNNFCEKVFCVLDDLGLPYTSRNFERFKHLTKSYHLYRMDNLVANEVEALDELWFDAEYLSSAFVKEVLDLMPVYAPGNVCLDTFNTMLLKMSYDPIDIDTFKKLHDENPELFKIAESGNTNHKVVSIEKVHYDEPIEVYCLTVDHDLHNFPLAAGIFVKNCEGDSASSGIVNNRDANIHAIMPLRGKVKNVVSKDVKEVLDNKELQDIYIAIGAGTNETPDLDAARYGKIIIASDADADGYNIRALLAGFFVTHLTFLVEAGMVYILETPLFMQDGKFFYDKDGIDESKPYDRFKGLGSFDNEQIKKLMLDPKSRRLTQITLSDPSYAKWILTSRQGRREILEDISAIDPDTKLEFKDIDMSKATEIVE